MPYCPLHNTRHGLPHGRICPDHSCECTWTVNDRNVVLQNTSRCEIHRNDPRRNPEVPR